MSGVRFRAGALAAVTALLAGGLAACSSSRSGPADVLSKIDAQQQTQAVATPPAAAAASKCTSPYKAEASYPKLASLPDTLPSGSLEATIKNRGFLVVGVAGDTRLLGSWNRLTDAEPVGFDIDVAKAIGRAIFGADGHVRFKVITAGQRFPQVNQGYDQKGVDLVVRAVSMTCDRWAATFTDPTKATGSAFSVAYLKSDQRILVHKGVASLDDLIKKKKATASADATVDPTVTVCAPAASTSLAKITGMAGVKAVAVAIHSDCLALWQEGRVDAITGDDVILAGFKAQDATAEIPGGKPLDTTPYGVAVAKSHPEFVAYVNAVMATQQFRSAWQAAYDKYLSEPLQLAPKTFPTPDYSRPLPG